MDCKLTLSIDFGYKNLGLALVKNGELSNTPLFAATLHYDPNQLSRKVEDRAELRGMRRTRKTKKVRLRLLRERLTATGLDPATVQELVRFSKRRGYASLFEERERVSPKKKEEGETEVLFRFSREDFFKALENGILSLVPTEKSESVLRICEQVLNREGNRFNEVRPIRIEAPIIGARFS
ncbi:MAG: hypothetical protein EHM36_13300 [Deltaproteobacteria bacterium]|nr:MAG: hypothetical protein EHM36_13300 [Deltaproteobacteria bacterium]